MESLVRRYIVTKGQEKPLLDACIIFHTEVDVCAILFVLQSILLDFLDSVNIRYRVCTGMFPDFL